MNATQGDDITELITQTFSATDLTYDTEPAVILPDPLAPPPPPTPGFFRRASNKPPAGQESLFDLSEEPARTEYDH